VQAITAVLRRRSPASRRRQCRDHRDSDPPVIFDTAHPEESLITQLWRIKGGNLGMRPSDLRADDHCHRLRFHGDDFFTAVNS